jgi:iron(III) transport system permease protein
MELQTSLAVTGRSRILAVSGAWLPALLAAGGFLALPFARPGRPFLEFGGEFFGWQLNEPVLWLMFACAVAALAVSLLKLPVVRRAELITLLGAGGFLLGTGWLLQTGVPFGLGALVVLPALVIVTGNGLSESGRIQGDAFLSSGILLVALFVILFILYPLAMVLISAFVRNGVFTLEQFRATLSHPLFLLLENSRTERSELALTLWFSAGGAALLGAGAFLRRKALPRVALQLLAGAAAGFLIGLMTFGRGAVPTSLLLVLIVAPSCTLLGLAFAILGQRSRFRPVSRSLDVISILPIITPPFILAFAMIFLLGRRGIISYELLGLSSNNIYGVTGVALAQILAFTPVAYLLLRGSLAALNPALEEAAQTLGANRWYLLRSVTWPLVRPGLAAAGLLSMIESLADFGNPIILGGDRNFLATEVYLSLTGRYNAGEAAVYGVVLLAFVLLAFYLQHWWVGGGSFVTVTGKPAAGSVVPLPRLLEGILTALLVVWTLFVAALYFSIVYGSFTQLWGVNYTLTLKHYQDFMRAGWPVFLYTARVAAISAVPAMLVGFLVAYLVSRQKFFGRRFIEIGSLLSFATPGTVMGVAYIFAFNTGPWLLTASAVIIIIALVFRNMPVAIRAAVSGLAQIDPSLEEASTMLRARTLTTLRRVLFPLLINTLVTGLIFAFVSAMTAVSQVIFLVSPGNQLATVLMLGWIEQGQLGRGAAMGTVLIISLLTLILILLGLARLLGNRMTGVKH